MSDPGTRWEYGINIDFVGKAVEAVSGKRLDAYLRDHLFTPLGMSDTGFKIGDSQRKRLVAMHARGEDGTLAADTVRTRCRIRNSIWAAAGCTAPRATISSSPR